jgi:hypothetical protein
MSCHEFGVLTGRQQEQQIGGGARVARIFLPAIDNCSAIRLVGRGHRRANAPREAARGELASTVETRRRAS